MDRRQIALKLVMDAFGLPVRVDNFNDRLILQKTVHLAQAAGIQLGYYFRWYLRGPYCPAVADDGFCIATELARNLDDSKGWTLDEASSTRLDRIRGLLAAHHRTAAERGALARRLELLASVHYLVDRKQVSGREPAKVVAVLQRFGKDFGEAEVSRALGDLRDYGLLF